jgi:CRISPR-associated protein Csb1
MTDRFDHWLSDSGPVAVLIRQYLEPAAGDGAVIFPATFAPPEGSNEVPGYVIDSLSSGGVCLIDSVGSQANRLEPIFLRTEYKELIPDVTVRVNSREVSILKAGHRAADAVIRFSNLRPEFDRAFLAYRDEGNAEPLAKLAPTSLVFGAWDSRETGAKVPRLVESTVRAYGAERLTRSAQYFAALEKDELEELGLEPEKKKKALSEQGLLDSPSGRTHGGIVARGGVIREALLNLVAARALLAGEAGRTRKLQRYILGLCLIVFTAPVELYLRQGCLLVISPTKPADQFTISRDGRREPFDVSEAEARAFAAAAAEAFGVGKSREGVFDPKIAKAKLDEKTKKGKSGG